MTYRDKISGKSYGDCDSSAIVASLSVVSVGQKLWEQPRFLWVLQWCPQAMHEDPSVCKHREGGTGLIFPVYLRPANAPGDCQRGFPEFLTLKAGLDLTMMLCTSGLCNSFHC